MIHQKSGNVSNVYTPKTDIVHSSVLGGPSLRYTQLRERDEEKWRQFQMMEDKGPVAEKGDLNVDAKTCLSIAADHLDAFCVQVHMRAMTA